MKKLTIALATTLLATSSFAQNSNLAMLQAGQMGVKAHGGFIQGGIGVSALVMPVRIQKQGWTSITEEMKTLSSVGVHPSLAIGYLHQNNILQSMVGVELEAVANVMKNEYNIEQNAINLDLYFKGRRGMSNIKFIGEVKGGLTLTPEDNDVQIGANIGAALGVGFDLNRNFALDLTFPVAATFHIPGMTFRGGVKLDALIKF